MLPPPGITEPRPRFWGAVHAGRRCTPLTTALVAAVLAFSALALAACGEDDDGSAGSSAPAPSAAASALPGGSQAATGGIAVSGTGVVTSVPDQARFSFGVRAEADTADEALERTSAATSAVLDALRQAGIDDEDIQTQQVSIFPIYSGDSGRVTGFSASNSVSVLVRKLDEAGQVVDAAVDAGANEVFGPTLDISDVATLADEALELAVEDARTRAQALAQAAGVELGEIVAISETGTPVGRTGAVPEAAADSAFVPIEPGTQEVSVTVSATFAIG